MSKQKIKKILLKRGILLVAVASIFSFSFADQLPKLPEGVYLQHIGESDKPIVPLVFASGQPTDEALLQLFGKEDGQRAMVFILPKTNLERITFIVNSFIVKHRAAVVGYEFGTFKVTVVAGRSIKTSTLGKKVVKDILAKIRLDTRARHDSFYEQITSLERRLQ